MSIRLRTVDGCLVALCGYETNPKIGDRYIDDGEHYALAAKFARDRREGLEREVPDVPAVYPEHDAANAKERVRSAWDRTDLGPDVPTNKEAKLWTRNASN